MRIDFDPSKNERNVAERELPFERVADFDFASAIVMRDTRRAYAEPRFIAVGYLDDRLHVLCFTPADGGIRVISFRKANKREAKRHEKAIYRTPTD